MSSTGLILIAVSLGFVAMVFALRRRIARHGAGRLAQLAFKRHHGTRIGELLGGGPDPASGSPWIEIMLDGRRCRLVAAPIGDGVLQAGIDLTAWTIPVELWHTDPAAPELDVPDGIDEAAALDIAQRLAELQVDNVATGSVGRGIAHIARIRFRDVDALPELLAELAPLLAELEALAPATS